jgi:3-methylfumaryl-CoA hydratase
MTAGITAEDVQAWQGAIGRTETRTEVLDPESLRRFAAAIGDDLDVARTQPSLGHWAFFLPVVPGTEIGEDGHSKRGGFLPAVTLPRRMFAGARFQFGAPLALGQAATRISTIADVKHKAGRAGDLVFVEVEHVISQAGAMCVTERQTIVYRDEGERAPPIVPTPQPREPGDQLWLPGPVDLFRFSAVTFNSHRIHYDAAYTVEREGYPGLLVHGPFTAAKLHGYARAKAGRSLGTFAFRAMAPLFVSQPVRLTAGQEAGTVHAMRCDGAVAIAASWQV